MKLGGNKVTLGQTIESRYLKKEEEETCHICQGSLGDGEKIRTLPCMHFYHSECFEEWVEEKATCPKC